MLMFNILFGRRMRNIAVLASAAIFFFVLGLDLVFVEGFVVCGKGSTLEWKMIRRYRRIQTTAAMSTVTHLAIPDYGKMGDCDVDDDGDFHYDYDKENNICDEARGSDFPLLCPSSCPSRTFGASNIKVSYHQIEADDSIGDNDVQLLPLQKHHARTARRNSSSRRKQLGGANYSESLFAHKIISDDNILSHNDGSVLGKSQSVDHDIPSLDFIYENLSRFRITKSSDVLLEEYQNEKRIYHKNYPSDREIIIDSSAAKESSESLLQQQQKHILLLKQDRLRSKIRAECRASLSLTIEETLKIIYCDSHICVVDKPSGVLSVPGHRRNPSLADLVYDTIEPSSYDAESSIDNIDQTVVHRLDMATSGIIVYALSKEALQKLHITFRDREVQKTYQALVEGHIFLSFRNEETPKNHYPTTTEHQQSPSSLVHSSPFGCCGTMEGEIDVALERDPNNPPYMRIAQSRLEKQYENADEKHNKFWREAPKPSKTTWSILAYEYDINRRPVTRLELVPHTGRTHQLRVHTSQVLGAPIVGDEIYGNGDGKAPLCLHARQLCIKHPISGGAMVFEADPPF
uniref:Pseudouridine synthase RsuA/RluA-like domain-containing protein n=1 Tax=Pseudo-nitzschia australis TaxID=44445 RepID=A0A7S4APV4_9STRA